MAMELNKRDSEICKLMRANFEKFASEIEEICGLSNIDDKWLDTKQVCELFRVNIRTLNNYRQKGIIPYSRFGNKCFYKISDIKLILENKEK